MSSVEDALAYWTHHEGENVSADGDGLVAAFKAGWKLAGGDQRLLAVDLLQALVFQCCGARAGKQFCEGFGCKSVNDIRKALGDTDLETDEEFEATEDESEGAEGRCDAVSAEGARCTLPAGSHTMHVPEGESLDDAEEHTWEPGEINGLVSSAYDHCRLLEAESLLRKVDPPEELLEEYRGAVHAITQLSAMVAERMEAGIA
jgi:hypothetical protein